MTTMASGIKELASWMGFLGVPSIFAIIVFIIKHMRRYTNKIQVLCKAQQAQMRAQLLELYHVYKERGYITEEEMEEWENQYQAYHSLGSNGVLDKRRDELMRLPSTPQLPIKSKYSIRRR